MTRAAILKFAVSCGAIKFKILSRTDKTALAQNFRSEFERNFENSF
ncbi:hypothetical protein [uncultured Campylobacter sp.]|nr:hypothetical protein [uncultured Campylobacter sp.]